MVVGDGSAWGNLRSKVWRRMEVAVGFGRFGVFALGEFRVCIYLELWCGEWFSAFICYYFCVVRVDCVFENSSEMGVRRVLVFFLFLGFMGFMDIFINLC